MLCFRHIIVDTLHTSITKNDNDDNVDNNNNIKKEAKNILKIQRPHNRYSVHVEYKNKDIPIIIGLTGTISKSLR
jgi:hypothetical protein